MIYFELLTSLSQILKACFHMICHMIEILLFHNASQVKVLYFPLRHIDTKFFILHQSLFLILSVNYNSLHFKRDSFCDVLITQIISSCDVYMMCHRLDKLYSCDTSQVPKVIPLRHNTIT